MSQIDKLKGLLARVEQRRAEPRLVAVSNAATLPSANTNLASLATAPTSPVPARAPQLELAPKQPAVSMEEAIASAPSSIPPPPPTGERAGTRPPSLPPLSRTPFPPPPSSTVPPPSQLRSEPPARAPTEVLPPVPLRIAPNPPVQLEPVVRATSSSRIEAPKTFGELLEQSLALRPKSG